MSRTMEFAAFQVALLLLPLTARAALCSNYRDASTCEGRNDGGCSCLWEVSAGLGSTSGDDKSDGKCVKSKRCDGFGTTGIGITGDSPQRCPPGMSSNSGNATSAAGGLEDISCVVCPAGRYSSEAGSTACAPCRIGSFSAFAGQSECSSCSLGRTTEMMGSTSCMQEAGSGPSGFSCRDVRDVYEATGCCGNPSKNIMLPARSRRLDSNRDAADTQELLASIRDTYQQFQKKGDHLEAKRFTAHVQRILRLYI